MEIYASEYIARSSKELRHRNWPRNPCLLSTLGLSVDRKVGDLISIPTHCWELCPIRANNMIGVSQSMSLQESMRRIGTKVIRRLSRIIRRTWTSIVTRPYDPIDLFAMLVCIMLSVSSHLFTSLRVLCTSINDIVSLNSQYIIISLISPSAYPSSPALFEHWRGPFNIRCICSWTKRSMHRSKGGKKI